jgi:hypothetical protein
MAGLDPATHALPLPPDSSAASSPQQIKVCYFILANKRALF